MGSKRLASLATAAVVLTASAFPVFFSTPAAAQSVTLPKTLTFTAYDTGSSGFNIAVAVGKMYKDKHGTDVRVLPAGNDVARLAPLKGGRAQASYMGVGVYFAQEGMFEFGVKEWGPQALRLILAANDCNAIGLGVAKDTGVKQIKDLKGKRIGMVVGSPALNQNALAIIAFGGLTKADVKLVEFSSYGAMWKGLVNNEADAAIASTISAQPKEVETSPRGLVFPPTPAADKAGWARIQKISPYYAPHVATCGIGISKEKPAELPNYPYPIFSAYASQSPDLVYAMAKSMIVNYDAYKDATPGAAGLELKRQLLKWAIPYHEGAVKAFKEAGVWKPEHEAYQAALVKRQGVLEAAWNGMVKGSPPEDKDAFYKAWQTVRAAALRKAGLEVIFE
jgi:TRAP transporter TAXI family solute receptor